MWGWVRDFCLSFYISKVWIIRFWTSQKLLSVSPHAVLISTTEDNILKDQSITAQILLNKAKDENLEEILDEVFFQFFFLITTWNFWASHNPHFSDSISCWKYLLHRISKQEFSISYLISKIIFYRTLDGARNSAWNAAGNPRARKRLVEAP